MKSKRSLDIKRGQLWFYDIGDASDASDTSIDLVTDVRDNGTVMVYEMWSSGKKMHGILRPEEALGYIDKGFYTLLEDT